MSNPFCPEEDGSEAANETADCRRFRLRRFSIAVAFCQRASSGSIDGLIQRAPLAPMKDAAATPRGKKPSV